jgi:hypothetical protein
MARTAGDDEIDEAINGKLTNFNSSGNVRQTRTPKSSTHILSKNEELQGKNTEGSEL